MHTIPHSFTKFKSAFTLAKREGDIALFERKRDGEPTGYEVVRIRKYPTYEVPGATIEAHEAMPPDESWGEEGWTFTTASHDEPEHAALEKFYTQVGINPHTTVMGTPTGEPRGRKRADFEIELPPIGTLFTVKELAAKYPERSVPFIHSRVNEFIEQGRVELVEKRKIAGAVGKPTNVYRVALK